MSDNLVEQKQWCEAGHLLDQASVRENEADQQGFLFPCRCVRRRKVLPPVPYSEIRQMRAVKRAARRCVARAILLEKRAIAILDFDRAVIGQKPFHPALQLDFGQRKFRTMITSGIAGWR